MVDLKKLREAKKQPPVIDPIEIFRRLPKSARIKDLYGSQVEVLQAWFKSRADTDHVLKLHTGGGKTLVGLLIAQSILNETGEPVLYICPNNQLVGQTLEKAQQYSLPAVPYEKPFPDDFLNGKSVLVANYSHLFNGMSRFGMRGKDFIRLGGLIVDDAHVGSNVLRDSFTIRLKRSGDENVTDGSTDEVYETLATTFRYAFKELGQLGTFDDVVSGGDYAILEIPYWAWQDKLDAVQALLKDNVEGRYELVWPLLRDSLKYCHCLITKNSIAITPIFPLVDLIPAFSECKRRIFMSATIPDDSEIVRSFDASPEALQKPLVSKSLAGVSERMILVPELMDFKFKDVLATLRGLAQNAAKTVSTVILVPSGYAAKTWTEVASYPDTSKAVEAALRELVGGKTHGPVVFASRYDGIDLPDDSCRVLILSGLPRAVAEYETHRANSFAGASSLNRAIAQKIEQGMGRAARGPGDFCVVIIAGRDLVAWLGRDSNLKFLTTSTRSQLEMGMEISKSVSVAKEFTETINRCLQREKEWVKYHAETLADLTLEVNVEEDAIEGASAERRALQLWRDGYHEKAIAKLTKRASSEKVDRAERGWLFQLAARVALDWGKKDLALELQQHAFAQNRNLFRPLAKDQKWELVLPGKQAESIVGRIGPFRFKRGYIAEFEETVSLLVPQSSSNQFESALSELGSILGFEASRPEKQFGNGPDVLWIISKTTGLVIEAKSRKNQANSLSKEQHGQLLVAENWFKDTYKGMTGIRVSVHPSVTATKNAVPSGTKALTLAKLNELIAETRQLVIAICESGHPDKELVHYCGELLKKSNLTPERLVAYYLIDFEVTEVD
jgi:replicative superfamily II helicase